MKPKYVYSFSIDSTEGNRDMRDLLGGKGANLAEMCLLGLPIPPGFTITTEACEQYYQQGRKHPPGMDEEVRDKLRELEQTMNRTFGSDRDPLLVSIRSGAAVSMPGMMDSVLNLGLNDRSVKGLARQSGNTRFAYDSYRRFIQMFANVVLKVEHEMFEEILEAQKVSKNVSLDVELDEKDFIDIVNRYKKLVKEQTGESFPQDPVDQLWRAIDAVFDSWNNKRAVTYRRLEHITGLRGTAVNVQAMVFGNMGEESGTGVAFTRNASTGENEFYAEYLMNAQGEDVVAGIRTPGHIDDLKKQNPDIYDELLSYKEKLENHYRDMQDIEFTIQQGKLYILQTRNGKRTTQAAIKIALDLVDEGVINKREAIMRVTPKQLDQILHPAIGAGEKYSAIARGLAASPGAAVGKIVFSAPRAEKMALQGEKVILVRKETSPEDIGGMDAAQGILTATGGLTSHAAVVARGMGKCCVVGCAGLSIKENNGCEIGGKAFNEGDLITLNGSTGEVIAGALKLVTPEISGDFERFMEWVDNEREIGVRTNADSPKDSSVARSFGAEGIGLCRTEHMFFEGDRIDAMREMILADNREERQKALHKILPMQLEDFCGIFEVMAGFPVTVRLLDPPLHEFLPQNQEEMAELAGKMKVDVSVLKRKAEKLSEFNPMLGHRGCRLAITYPEIPQMQTEAIIRAALAVQGKGLEVFPEIMVPLTSTVGEFLLLKQVILETAEKIFSESGERIEFRIGTMVETPRACLVADQIAGEAEFFSFGTNDLTQMTFGFSRDDAGVFLQMYVDRGILEQDPFQVLDSQGVGALVDIAIKKGRQVRNGLKIGICGEHGGEPQSVDFCHRAGVDYVSCSPYRVPLARLAAAQSKIMLEGRTYHG